MEGANATLEGVRGQLGLASAEEANLRAQASGLMGLTRTLLDAVTEAQQPGLAHQIAAVTAAMGALSARVDDAYDTVTDPRAAGVASAVEEGIPASGGIASFIDSKLAAILGTRPGGSQAPPPAVGLTAGKPVVSPGKPVGTPVASPRGGGDTVLYSSRQAPSGSGDAVTTPTTPQSPSHKAPSRRPPPEPEPPAPRRRLPRPPPRSE